jgi:hypothetical protein
MIHIDGGVERAHVTIGDPARQPAERAADGRLPQQGRRSTRARHRRRKIVSAVGECRQVERVDQRARGVAGNHIHLLARQRP